jgi:hypothetical protein
LASSGLFVMSIEAILLSLLTSVQMNDSQCL